LPKNELKEKIINFIGMQFENIFENNKVWIQRKLELDKDYFTKLSKGQSPEILFIGCSDSRVTAEEIMGAVPGEIFIHRNIANMVISIDLNINSVINYAVKYLKVKKIVICGHYECGGVKASLTAKDLGVLNPWLRNIRDVYRIHNVELDAIQNEQEKFDKLVELNVKEQCINVMKFAEIQSAYVEEGLTVHGWVFNMRNGELIDLNIDLAVEFSKIRDIYNLFE
jgi:carbonic anhydrase